MNFGRFFVIAGKKTQQGHGLQREKNRNKMKHVGGHSGKQEGMVTVVSWA